MSERLRANEQFVVVVNTAPGAVGRADIARYVRADPGIAHLPDTPVSLVNFGEAVNFPLILGFVLALFGAATLLHLLVVSVARRRHEIGLLKALGFVKGQVGATVCWQASTVALVGIIVGIPLGVALGQCRVAGLRHQSGCRTRIRRAGRGGGRLGWVCSWCPICWPWRRL